MKEFVDAVKDKWPHALIQFEDFSTSKAIDLLETHRYRARVFNDDIQVRSWFFFSASATAFHALLLVSFYLILSLPFSFLRLLFVVFPFSLGVL